MEAEPAMLLDADDSQLVLMCWQAAAMADAEEADAAQQQARRLAQIAVLLGVPVWAVEQAGWGAFDAQLKRLAVRTVETDSFNACDAALPALLRPPAKPPSGNARSLPRHLLRPAAEPAPGRQQIVLAGGAAHVGVVQTALGLLEEDFEVWVVTDASSARSARDRDAAYDRLAGAGVELVTTEMVAFEWLGGSRHPAYERALALLRPGARS